MFKRNRKNFEKNENCKFFENLRTKNFSVFFGIFSKNFFRLFTAPCVLYDTLYNVLSVYDNVFQLIRLAEGRFQVLKFELEVRIFPKFGNRNRTEPSIFDPEPNRNRTEPNREPKKPSIFDPEPNRNRTENRNYKGRHQKLGSNNGE